MSDFAGILSAIGSFGTAFGSLWDALTGGRRQRQVMLTADRINDENYEKQLADQRQLIAEQREYESIGAQMRRARASGVSPIAALGSSLGSSAMGASVPSEAGATIPTSSPVSASLANASTSFSNAEASLRGALLGDTQRKLDELKLSLAIETYDSKVKQEEFSAESLKNQSNLYAVQVDKNTNESKMIKANEEYLNALTNRVTSLTPLEADKLGAEYMQMMLDYYSSEMDVEIKQSTLPAQCMQYWANLGLTLRSSELARANAIGSLENAKSNRLSVYAQFLGIAESKRHNISMEELQRVHEENVKEFNDMTIEVQQGNLSHEKFKTWMNLGTKVALGAVGASLGFFVAGPVGAAYGASIGLGTSLAVPGMMPSAAKQSKPIGFGRN